MYKITEYRHMCERKGAITEKHKISIQNLHFAFFKKNDLNVLTLLG